MSSVRSTESGLQTDSNTDFFNGIRQELSFRTPTRDDRFGVDTVEEVG
jgi:hypothetical protein